MATQAGLFSAALTAFIIDSKQNLKVNPQDQMVYYLQQNVAILDQISRQIPSIAPQFSIPSAPPTPFPAFRPSASDIRVNAFWFMSLVFSLAAALLAILVQQWVRKYMQVLQRYSDPLNSARLRQYLNEGLEGWYMPIVAEAVPGVLHVSVFLFFAGLCDSVLNINTTVGLSTTVPIGITSLLYIFTSIAPAIYPQSPYHTSFSGLIWYLIQNFGSGRYRYRDSDGKSIPVSPNMAQGQLQLAMEETMDRKRRDGRAIRWLVSNMTGDAEMDSLAMAVPGSFDTAWGEQVWEVVFSTIEDNGIRNEMSRFQGVLGSIMHRHGSRTASDTHENTATHPQEHKQGYEIVRMLGAGVSRMLGTCLDPSRFPTHEQWRRRARGSVEATAWLVCHAGAELGQFGDMIKLLGDIGKDQTVRKSSSMGKDQSFVVHWTCLALVAIRPILESNRSLQDGARVASQRLERRDNVGEEQTHTDKIIEILNKASSCLNALSTELIWWGTLREEQAPEIFRQQESHISSLEQIVLDIENGGFPRDEWSIGSVQNFIGQFTHDVIIRQLPGVKFDLYDSETVDFSQFVELFRDADTLLFIFPLRNLKRIRTFAQTLRRILEGRESLHTITKPIKDLREFGALYWSDKVVL
jgi:Family of unknown function (DUF6535)